MCADRGHTEPHAGAPVPASVAVLDAVPVPLAVLDGGACIRAANLAWKRTLPPALSPGAHLPGECQKVFRLPAGDLDAGLRAIIAGEQESFHAECPYSDRDHSWVRLTIAPYRNGDFSGMLVTCVEFARQKPDSDEDGRRQTDKMLAVGRLVGGVAHDFANLLTLITGYGEIILSRMSAADPLRAELEEICNAANRGSRLTAQLLGFTRGRALEPKILDLNILVADMERMLRPIIGENVELIRAADPKLGKVRADSGQMEQVIMNLVLNARDAMPRGGRITVATTNVEYSPGDAREHGVQPGHYVLLSVCDTGEGMDADTMSHLFQPFFTTKTKGKGTGLGLSTVYGIVKQNGGDIWAQSQPGKGSTFNICLPSAEAAAEAAMTKPTGTRASAGTETILLVEDEDSVRRLLKHVLTRQGYTILEARDGPQALELLASHSGEVHLLLTDMVMPRMSGREVAQRVLEHRPGIKVVYMSGYTDDVLLRSGALKPGMSFLQKPLKPDTLGAKVREVLDTPAPALRS